MQFYQAQMSGALPDWNTISWRKSAHDGAEAQLDLVGGFYDAGGESIAALLHLVAQRTAAVCAEVALSSGRVCSPARWHVQKRVSTTTVQPAAVIQTVASARHGEHTQRYYYCYVCLLRLQMHAC
jgi:hypothetical protein